MFTLTQWTLVKLQSWKHVYPTEEERVGLKCRIQVDEFVGWIEQFIRAGCTDEHFSHKQSNIVPRHTLWRQRGYHAKPAGHQPIDLAGPLIDGSMPSSTYMAVNGSTQSHEAHHQLCLESSSFFFIFFFRVSDSQSQAKLIGNESTRREWHTDMHASTLKQSCLMRPGPICLLVPGIVMHGCPCPLLYISCLLHVSQVPNQGCFYLCEQAYPHHLSIIWSLVCS